MEGQTKRQWGVTSSISEALPTEKDLELNTQLIDELKRQNNFETPEGTERRVKVLKHLQKVTEEFVRRVGKAKGLSQSVIDNAGGKIFTFGSYALGVYGPGSDIDTLIVAPKHVDNVDFFKYFEPTLRDLSSPEEIEELSAVPDAYVPIIKLLFSGVDMDLLFVPLILSSVGPDLKLTDKSLLRGLDDTAMRSVNGTRVTDELLSSVPQVKTFRHATRTIKLWAQRRGIYGAKYGYPGGVAWAIMVARICQLYPFACGATVVSKFFNLMIKWHWPRPVMLKPIEEGTFGLRVWNPQLYHGDRSHLMPIITPAFPSMCATHNIMHSTKSILLQEMERADGIISAIVAGKKSWKDLFDRHTFFTLDHKYYLSVVAASRTKESHTPWSGWVESRVRLLVKGIDESDAGVEVARPYFKSFDRVHRCKDEDDVERVVQGSLDYTVPNSESGANNGTINGEGSSDDTQTIYTTTYYIGIQLQEGAKSLDISYPVAEFKRLVTTWANYDAELNSVRVVHTRNYDLPMDVFESGETRPARAKKTKSHKPAKRSFAETGIDVRESPAKRTSAVSSST